MKLLAILIVLLFFSASHAEEGRFAEVLASGTRQVRLAMDTPANRENLPFPEINKEMRETFLFDMNMSGTVVAFARDSAASPGGLSAGMVDFSPLLAEGYDLLVKSEYSLKGENLVLEYRLFDVINKKLLLSRRYLGTIREIRYFTHSFANEIVGVIDRAGGKGCFTSKIVYITTSSGNKEIAIMDWDGHNFRQITRNGSINLNPVFSPDGKEILFTSYKNGNPDLFRRPLSSGVDLKISSRKGLNITGSWSPDGKKIVLSLSKDGNSEIYTIDKNGDNPVRLTVNPAIDVSPVFSPDGAFIAFVSDRLGKPQIFIMNVDGGNVRRLTTLGSYNVTPAWSPRGDRIAYASMQDGFQIHTISVDGSDDRQLTASGNNENPAWSPDGRLIAYSSRQGRGEAINVMRANGEGQTRVSQGNGRATQPSWSFP